MTSIRTQFILSFGFLIILNLFPTEIYAQDATEPDLPTLRLLNQESGTSSLFGFSSGQREVRGTPFLFDDWKKAVIIQQNGKRSKESEILYKIDDHSLYFRNEKGVSYRLNEKQVVAFEVVGPNQEIQIFKQITNNKGSAGFYRVLFSDSDIQFLEHTAKTFKAGKESSDTYSAGKTYDEYRVDVTLYLYKGNELLPFSSKPKKLAELFKADEKKLARFLKDEKLSLKKTEDVTKALSKRAEWVD